MLTISGKGTVYVLDYGHRQVQCFDSEGNYKTRWAFKRSSDQEGLRLLDGLAVDKANNLYISDASAGKVRKIIPQGKVALSFDAQALQADKTETLLSVGIDHLGNVYLAKQGSQTIHKYDDTGIYIKSFETYAPVMHMIVNVLVD